MKITKEQLRKIIKEEIEAVVDESLLGKFKGAFSRKPAVDCSKFVELAKEMDGYVKQIETVSNSMSGPQASAWFKKENPKGFERMFDEGGIKKDLLEWIQAGGKPRGECYFAAERAGVGYRTMDRLMTYIPS